MVLTPIARALRAVERNISTVASASTSSSPAKPPSVVIRAEGSPEARTMASIMVVVVVLPLVPVTHTVTKLRLSASKSSMGRCSALRGLRGRAGKGGPEVAAHLGRDGVLDAGVLV